MIKVEARFTYVYETDDELEWILALLPAGAAPVVEKLLKRVTYTATQQVTV